MKILVTGATGFVGNHVTSILAKQGYDVVATSRNLDKAKTYDWFSQVSYIPCDLSFVKMNYYKFFREPDILIHLAWEGLDNYKDLLHFEKNLPVHYNFIKNMVCNGLRHVVAAGTCLEYGMQCGCLKEDLSPRPKVPYGLAKDTLRKNLDHLFNHYPVIFQWVRLFYLYGEGQNEKSLLSQLNSAIRKGDEFFNMSGGEQLRDYLPVENAAQYIVDIALQDKVQGIINCCSGTPISILKFVKNYLDENGSSIKLNPGFYPYPDYEPMAFWGDNKKLQRVLGQI